MISVIAKPIVIIFEGDNSFKIFKASTKDNKKISIKGYFPNLMISTYYEFNCDVKESLKYGVEYICRSYNPYIEKNKEGMVLYLKSFISGIGEKTSEKIYDLLGDDAIDEIIKDKNVLKKIKGLTQKKIDLIYDSIVENSMLNKIYIKLLEYGLSSQNISKLYIKYQNETLNVIENNPYILLSEIENFSFLRADMIAMRVKITPHDGRRLEECVKYILNQKCYESGNTYCYKDDILYNSLKYLNANSNEFIVESEIEDVILYLIGENKIISEDDRIYPKSLYYAEIGVKEEIYRIRALNLFKVYDRHILEDKLRDVENTYHIIYTTSQKEAIISAISNKISIITGGPGSGKTTIVKAIINLLALLDKKTITDDKFRSRVLLCAPTGRAAIRLGKECNLVSKTIHKALGYTEVDGFMYNEGNKLNENIIVIDEFSMVDIELANALFKAIKTNAQVLILGDSMQLPSVGPGNVLKELIDSKIINTNILKEVMRQDKDSKIVKLCKDITLKKIDSDIFKEKKDVYFYSMTSKGCIDFILRLVEKFINSGGNIFEDLQILIPIYASDVGIDSINKAIQEKFNQSTIKVVRGNKIFKVNDKVIQLKNDPDKGIMNGDIGRIISIDFTDKFLMIDFDSIKVKYSIEDLEELDLAYAISIHKSQGSEFKNVIVPIMLEYSIMLKIKLIYTAFSRAKEKLIILGNYDLLEQSLLKEEEKRQTTLLQRLTNNFLNFFKKEKESKDIIIEINDPTIPFKYLKEIDSKGVTPYDFLEKEIGNF